VRNRIRVNQLNVGWMASDNERRLQAAESGNPDRVEKAASRLPFGRLVDPEGPLAPSTSLSPMTPG
jgi:NAD(P)-dependent dehydrogenase (short-subunit alcohol dehydrogenase family)